MTYGVVSLRKTPASSNIYIPGSPAQAFQVHGNLWIGTAPPIGLAAAQFFDCVVLCACEYQVGNCIAGVEIVQIPLDDNYLGMKKWETQAAVQAASKVISWLDQNLRVLVTCQQGRNRSGLVCALTLMCGPTKMTPKQAVYTIRKARGEFALQNPHFLRFVEQFYKFRSGKLI